MVKVISLSEEAYKRLKARKGDNSFSEVVINLTTERRKQHITEFAGVFSENAKKWDKIKKQIYKDREKSSLREVKL